MELARVQGTIVSTAKTSKLKGHKLLLVNLITPDAKPTNNHLVAVDTVGAGKDEIVIIVRGSSARQADNMQHTPTDTSIVAIVDSIEFKGDIVFRKSD